MTYNEPNHRPEPEMGYPSEHEKTPKNQQNVVVSQPNAETDREKRGGKGWMVVIVAILAILLIGGMLFFNQDNKGGENVVRAPQEQQQADENIKVDAPDVNVDAPDVDAKGIEEGVKNGIEEGANAVMNENQ